MLGISRLFYLQTHSLCNSRIGIVLSVGQGKQKEKTMVIIQPPKAEEHELCLLVTQLLNHNIGFGVRRKRSIHNSSTVLIYQF